MRMILLLLSLSGFFLFFRWFRKELSPSFYPAVTVSIISLITCLGGIAGVLAWTAGLLLVLGILAFFVFGAFHLRQAKREGRRDVPFWGMLGSFLALCACAFFLLRQRFIYHYDDFSHWGLVVKIMLQESRLPSSTDGLMFPSYPLGSASFLYFCGCVLGADADVALWAQSIMLISFLLSLQSAAGKKWSGYLLTTLLIPLFAFYNSALDGLSVDNLLGAAFLAAMLLYLQHDREPHQIAPELMMILACCVLIKNSGVFLALMLVVLAALRLFREKKKVRLNWLWLLLPALVYLAWRIHLKTGFSDFGKHFMSLYTYYGTFRGKLRELGQIFRVILPVMVHPRTNHALLLIPAFALVFWAAEHEKRKRQKEIILICSVLFVLYEIGVVMMYICSMGTGELYAQNGEDFPRYNGTMICVLAGILVYMISKVQTRGKGRQTKKRYLYIFTALVLLVVCMSMNLKGLDTLEDSRKEYPDAYAFSRQTKGRTSSETQSISVVFHEKTVSDYEQYMANYYLYPAKNLKCYGAESDRTKLDDGSLLIDLREE